MGDQAADAYAVVVLRDELGAWQAGMLPETLGDDLEGLVDAVRQQPAPDAAFALVDVADEFFVVVRVQLDEVWPAGDLGIFSDLGLDEMELGAILADVDAYADEMLSAVARRLGFGEAYERVVDAVVG